MVNTDFAVGTIIFGVENDGSVIGVPPSDNLDKAQITLADDARQNFEPRLHLDILVEEIQGRKIIKVVGRRSTDVSVHQYRKVAYILEGTSKRALTFDEMLALHKRRDLAMHPGPWKCDRCGATRQTYLAFDEKNQRTFACGCGGEFSPA
jgi:predicted HTH transcriptional regulator